MPAYPPRTVSDAELERFYREIKNLHDYNLQTARQCRERTKTGWAWQSILSCLIRDGMILPHAARWASEIWPYAEQVTRGEGVDQFVASALTGAHKLAVILQHDPRGRDHIRSILGKHFVPYQDIIGRDIEARREFFGMRQPVMNPELEEFEKFLTLARVPLNPPGRTGLTGFESEFPESNN